MSKTKIDKRQNISSDSEEEDLALKVFYILIIYFLKFI
jgi:hypothetical protein